MRNILIIGDSYSTFEGYNPDGFDSYYSASSVNSDVNKVEDTWWHKVMTETGSSLVLNNSWSGSTICHTGYNNFDCSKTSSFIHRVDSLIESGFFKKNKIDTVFVFGGTNDSWANSPVGNLKYSNWEEGDLYCVLPAVCYLACMLKVTLPNSDIIFIVNSGLKNEISEGIRNACDYYGCKSIFLKDIDKISSHPTKKGMEQIKNQILKSIIL